MYLNSYFKDRGEASDEERKTYKSRNAWRMFIMRGKKRYTAFIVGFTLLLTGGLAGCKKDDDNPQPVTNVIYVNGTTSATSSGTTSGASSSGTTSRPATNAGSGTTSGSSGGNISGSGSTSGPGGKTTGGKTVKNDDDCDDDDHKHHDKHHHH